MVSQPSPPPESPDGSWHTRSRQEVARRLGASLEGLTATEAERRLAEWGPNRLPEAPRPHPLNRFIAQFKSPLIIVLLAAALIAFVVGKRLDPYVILAIVFLNAAIGFLQEQRAEQALDALKQMTAPRSRVVRDGRLMEINSNMVVVGDVIDLMPGDLVAADARLIWLQDLEVDESLLTGESVPKTKTTATLDNRHQPLAERDNLVFMGTVVTRGRARALVVATGRHTAMGDIAGSLAAAAETPPIRRRLIAFSKLLAGAALALMLTVGAIGTWRDIPFDELLLFTLSMVVSFIPEGLPIVVTVLLAVGVWRMAQRRALVRNLSAVEALGAVTVICSDKTGTLTQNQMTVREVALIDRDYQVTGEGYQPTGELIPTDNGHPALHWLLNVAALCNDSEVEERNNQWVVLGDPMEGALRVLALKANYEVDWQRHDELPFSSERRWMATLHETPEGNRITLLKGAPEVLLQRADLWLDQHGNRLPLKDEQRQVVERQIELLAQQARRTLAFAYVPEPAADSPLESGQAIWLGLAGMEDPPRKEAINAVRRCQAGKIRVVMVTGDHATTAAAIARQVGLHGHDGQVISGSDLNRIPDSQLDEVVKRVHVFARVDPQHKIRIVQALKRQGEQVAMTGDGINDAPALRQADVGVAMGTGTEVTKAASDMVLTDDNFATLVAAVEEGRVIGNNLRRVLVYLLSTNTGEVLIILVSLLLGLPLPLVAVQVLWMNLVTDGTLDKGLALEPGSRDIMQQPPRPPEAPLISRSGMARIAAMATLMMVGALLVYRHHMDAGVPLEKARTLTFNTLVAYQWMIGLTLRSLHLPVWRLPPNTYFLIGLAIAIALQVTVIYTPWFHAWFQTVPLSPLEFATTTAVALSALIAHEGYKLWTMNGQRTHSSTLDDSPPA